ncbi:hypothetical protein GCM10007897_08980 [Sphingobium jiangsuense]|uniref:ElaB/YqjD/DUF883 family membrane-anchored ribosome-binding protein n=1 Tax=Sphingobium jiangsuense TaxID=870476 RepID=A0A7W6BP59_9SPHN|nr:hypothetical protein [Sphingobium jiangsuense]MBB3927202.1 ElaB/YqjD/DUF883 family membrane-anchored ribosome-binding protein [Sphingobium jiangsuense]GLS99518.1 hypothetical protein GCM10007897_08980 [Sphingobium jiangsuense]
MNGPHETPAEQLAALDAITEDQRTRIRRLAGLTAERLRPARIAQDARNRALDLGLDAIDKARTMARAHPVRTVGLVAAVGAVIARKPLWRLSVSGYRRLRERFRPDDRNSAPSAATSED